MSWEAVRLDKVCIFLNGGTPSRQVDKFFEGNIPWITSADISEDQDIVSEARFYITQEAVDSSATKLIPKGNILLVSRTGVGKIAITGTDICISQDFTGIIPNKEVVNLRYLFRFLQSKKDYFVSHQRGATIQGITRKVISDLEIPLPPLEEQRHIAAILDQADRLRTLRREALAKLDRLLQATFLDMFGDPVTNPLRWEVKKLEELLTFMTSGSRGWAKYYSQSGTLFLRIQNVRNDELKLDDIAYVNAPDSAEKQRTTVKPGDILLSITADLGRTAVIPQNFPLANINQHLALLRVEGVIPEYLSSYLTSMGGQLQFQNLNREGVKAGLNFNDIKSLNILLPPESLQKNYALVKEKIRIQIKNHQQSLTQLDNLFNSLQQRAFSGELSERSVV